MISLFKDVYSREVRNFTPYQIMQWIIDGQWKERLEALKGLPKEEYNKQKIKLPGVTWAGTFSQRLADKLIDYSGLIVLDLDNLNPEVINDIKARIADEPCVFSAFVSPSGSGLKIVCAVNTTAEHHKHAFAHLKHFFETKYNLEVDPSGKDVSRLCFVSCDPFAVFRNATPFEVDLKFGEVQPKAQQKFPNTAPIFDQGKIFEVCKKWTDKHYSYSEGQRNSYLHALACAMNRCGVPMDDTKNLMDSVFDLPSEEIAHCCKSAYFHNQNEHGSVTVNSYGSLDNEPQKIYEANYSDDLVMNDIQRITGMLYHYKLPEKETMDIVAKVAKYYKGVGLADIQKKDLLTTINTAIAKYNENQANINEQKSLKYMFAENLAGMLVEANIDEHVVPTGFPPLDNAMRGGFMPGNLYACIGPDKVYKSILAQWFCTYSAIALKKPVLFLCGEMSAMQFYERLCLMVYGIDLYSMLKEKSLNKENAQEFIDKMNQALGNNFFVVFNSGWTKEQILATIEDIKFKHGKNIEMIAVDGVTQLDWGREKNEIGSTINNSAMLKDLAKEAHDGKGMVVLALYHIAGENNKMYRPMGLKVRGGVKTLANLDGYFSHSLFEDVATESTPNDIAYISGKFYLRYTDKRNNGGDTNMTVLVPNNLSLELEGSNPNSYETRYGQQEMFQ